MFLSTRVPRIPRLTSAVRLIRPLSLKPDFSKYKLKEGPPGNIVGTVNDAYTPPQANFHEGGHHWAYEKIVSTAMIPLTAAPFILGPDLPIVDTVWAVTCLVHCHMGFKSCIIDYIPKRVYGVWHTYASRLLSLGTGVGLYGIYLLETTQNGVFTILASIWGA
ncbi:hypothetical protein CANTEDRAFT_108004 [Yamadazyma tenuis ATCC 10573]|uniref:Succinate dehydrogenase [ubiquinone] cytochrome b small subunit n=1 Tax=Candida tenuis (strain ATCC 10573 / BCRC 21748 / CBS 615 / JCM 9827 / NBRC 10315 / NRRL Y-1498 / VKM Y-70) TaxID=590646 RepID=G3BAB3_CANTC|nr:uncharacterized protein CANTEDRAFT_108004 [Yamadazyma tenuis ATCC 10573]EGV61401.1 hypothetical protein CANTEDRAFT_108004 [Yamadazyma tenuis ATCC 10573]